VLGARSLDALADVLLVALQADSRSQRRSDPNPRCDT
jgi:hypothetical protein